MDKPIKARAGNSLKWHGLAPSQKLGGSQIHRGHPEWTEHHSVGGFGDPFSGHLQWLRSSPSKRGGHVQSVGFFEVHSLWSCFQEGVLQEGIIQSLKGDAADMVWFLSPTSSVKAILDKLDSLYGSVSTFDVMMQGFYRESQGSVSLLPIMSQG